MPHFGRFDMSSGATVARSPSSQTAGTSPYTYTAPADGMVVVSGGTVSLVQHNRSGTLTALGLLSGVIPVSKGDGVRVTWAVTAPTVTFIPS